MGRQLAELSPRFRPIAVELLARLVEAQIAVLITCTGRSPSEQAAAVATGHSLVVHSKHQDGDAIDIVPYDQYVLKGNDKLQWDTKDPVWKRIGAIGEALGLRWGGRFHPMNSVGVGFDPGHFEYHSPKPDTTTRA